MNDTFTPLHNDDGEVIFVTFKTMDNIETAKEKLRELRNLGSDDNEANASQVRDILEKVLRDIGLQELVEIKQEIKTKPFG